MRDKTPDEIRRETVPVKHDGIVYGLLGGLLGFLLWFGGWGLFHQKQVMEFPDYCTYALNSSTAGFSLLGAPARAHKARGMSADFLSYDILRHGNQDHRYDQELIRHGRYPKGEDPAEWVYVNSAVKPLYSDDPLMVLKWPMGLTLLTILFCTVWGLVSDAKYHAAVVGGIHLDGTIIATPEKYNREVKGDGVKYALKSWSDR